MRIQLSHPRVLGDGSKGSFKHYPKGQHEVAEAVAEHWFTKSLMESGDITVMAEPKPEKQAAVKPQAPAQKASEPVSKKSS